jgi:hypothetical protein
MGTKLLPPFAALRIHGTGIEAVAKSGAPAMVRRFRMATQTVRGVTHFAIDGRGEENSKVDYFLSVRKSSGSTLFEKLAVSGQANSGQPNQNQRRVTTLCRFLGDIG